MNEDDAHFKKTIKYDVHERIPFYCPIGKNEATISIMVEPDPHGDESGKHSHFHTATMCQNMKIVDIPEPDRCGITNSTCPFISPVGEERDPERRKFRYASTIIQKIASIEFHGLQLVNEILQKKKLKPIDTLTVAELEKILIVSNLIDTETYQKFNKLRRMRNKFAHSPNEYLKFTEKNFMIGRMKQISCLLLLWNYWKILIKQKKLKKRKQPNRTFLHFLFNHEFSIIKKS